MDLSAEARVDLGCDHDRVVDVPARLGVDDLLMRVDMLSKVLLGGHGLRMEEGVIYNNNTAGRLISLMAVRGHGLEIAWILGSGVAVA